MRRLRFLTLCAVAALAMLGARYTFGHIRLSNPGNGSELFWVAPDNISIVLNEAGSDDVSDGSDLAALRLAIGAWNADSGSAARLVEDSSPTQMARTDWESDPLHLLLFDEDNSSGYFPSGSSTVALTPIWFSGGGAITDADVLFNGKGYRFTTKGELGSFDVADVATHELGHLLGLDHSGHVGASLYPYVSPHLVLHRSPAEDDFAGLRHAYPDGSNGRIRGRVVRQADDSGVAGALVVARAANGRSLASDLADSNGNYDLQGLLPGTYTLYASPLDEPVGAGNLTGGQPVESDFEPAFLGAPVVLAAGESIDAGELAVGADVVLNLGRSIDPLPLEVVAGETSNLSLRGSGLTIGSALSSSDSNLGVSVGAWLTSSVHFSVTVPAGTEPGHADLEVVGAGGERAILPGALEIVPPQPSVSLVLPNSASTAGGQPITVFGTGFRSGARVVIGDQIYVDGEPGGATVVDSTSITLSSRPTLAGLHDVVVIDETGVEGRLSNGLLLSSQPVIDTIFPPAGDAAGGTELVLRGAAFEDGLSVSIDGEPQTGVVFDGQNRVRVTTAGGLPGGPYSLTITNPGGALATGAFVYVSQADPELLSISPAAGEAQGGEEIVLSGAHFTPDSVVVFGADADTGEGGTQATDVVYVDANTLRVTTPNHANGTVSVMVCDASSEQATVLPSSFSFSGAEPAGGSGGGCAAAPGRVGPTRPGDVLRGTWWIAAVLLALRIDAWRRRKSPQPLRAHTRRHRS